jgi:protease I
MTNRLTGRRVAVLAADGVEEPALVRPRQAVEDEGATTELLSTTDDAVQALGADRYPADRHPVDKRLSEASPDDYDALIVPGRMDSTAADFVRTFVDSGKPVGMICEGPLALVEAGVARGRTLISHSGTGVDLASFCDQIVVEFARGRLKAS